MVQLGLHASTAGGTGLIPDWGTKIRCAVQCDKKKMKTLKKKKQVVMDTDKERA